MGREKIMLYDIRDTDKAIATLQRLTGVSSAIWSNEKKKNVCRINYSDVDKDIERIIKRYNGYYPQIDNLEFVITHLTTSGNGCISILNDGLIDLKKAYQKSDSELRTFLEAKGIEIILDSKCLKYKGKYYDISYVKCPWNHESEEYAAWSVGRKFYYDFTVCGFLSINKNRPYAGNVHKRPEILMDLDNLLKTNLQNEWIQSHEAFEIVFKIPFRNILYDGWDSDTEDDIVMSYLTNAYMCMSLEPNTKEVLCRNETEIYPKQILECNRFTLWDRY